MANFEDIVAVLQLIHTQGIGVKSFYRLVEEHGTAEAAVKAVQTKGKFKPWSKNLAEEEIKKAQSLGLCIIVHCL